VVGYGPDDAWDALLPTPQVPQHPPQVASPPPPPPPPRMPGF
jgi:hypothetical protein